MDLFVGRRRELRELRRLSKKGARLLTIAGPPGIGTSSLAREVVQTMKGDRQTFACDVALAKRPEDVVRYIGAAADPAATASARDRATQLRNIAAEMEEGVLFVDNVGITSETTKEVIAELLRLSSDLRVVVAATAPLGADDETVYRVGPLLLRDACLLFRTRLRERGTRRTFSSEDNDSIKSIVERVDRFPLAISLAAQRSDAMTLPELDAALARDLWEVDDPNVDSTLLASVSIAWRALSAAERTALTALSVVNGSFGVPVAEAVFAGAGLETGTRSVTSVLRSLATRSAIQAEEGRAPRYRMHRPLRAHAWAQASRESKDSILAGHARYFVSMGKHWSRGDTNADGPYPYKRLRDERENLFDAFSWAANNDAALAVEAAKIISTYARFEGPNDSIAAVLDEAVRVAEGSNDTALAAALSVRGNFLRWRGEHDRAMNDFVRARGLGACDDTPEVRLRVRVGLAGLYRAMGQSERAVLEASRAVADFQSDDAPSNEATELASACMCLLGVVQRDEGLCRRALQILRGQNEIFELYARILLSEVLMEAGDLEGAEAELSTVVDRARVLGTPMLYASSTTDYARVLYARGKVTDALRLGEEALHANRFSNYGRARSLRIVAMAELGLGELARVGERLLLSIDIAKSLKAYPTQVESMAALSVAQCILGRREEAQRLLQRATEVDSKTGGSYSGPLSYVRMAINAEGAPPEQGRGLGMAVVRQLCGPLLYPDAKLDTAWSGLEVDPDGSWFRISGASSVDIERRQIMRRLLNRLVAERLRSPGAPVSLGELVASAWPEEKLLVKTAKNRIHNAVANLRRLGLEPLKSNGEGYFLDPNTPVRVSC